MEYRNLGGTGAKVSSLCLGAMTFGEANEASMMHGVSCDEETAHAILSRAVDAGLNFIDTADVYGQEGLSERVIGSWFSRSGRRDEVVLATKFRFTMGTGPNDKGASRYHVVRAVDESLRRLQTDRIDLYQIHMQDVETPQEELLRALDDLVRQGKVVYIGCSNYAAYRLIESLWISDRRNLSRFVTLQAQYSLVSRELDREHIPLCKEYNLGVLPWSPLAGGFLTGKYERDGERPDDARLTKKSGWAKGFLTERNWDILDTVRSVAQELSSTPARVALAWCLAQPAVSSVIFGARTIEQLDENLAAAGLVIPPELLKRLDEVSRLDLAYPYNFMRNLQGRW